MSLDELESFDSVEKIDMTNKTQVKQMWKFYRHNMFTVNFFLNTLVFPSETNQFEKRLAANSWHLAQNPSGCISGFSGTNDNHRILPLQVKQYIPSSNEIDPVMSSIFSTNGRMLDVIIENTLGVHQLKASESLIETISALPHELHAIIDCGALLAGKDLAVIAHDILAILPKQGFSGVLYYDSERHNNWVVLERTGRICPNGLSPVSETEVFAIYDEPRCRGTDLKLRSNAVAVLTLGSDLCKDKLLQGAGRLRKLGRNQKLFMVGGNYMFGNIFDRGKQSEGVIQKKATVAQVLSWSMENTVQETAAGLSNWSNQALFFLSTFGKGHQTCITDEVIKLDAMYAKSFVEQYVTSMFEHAYCYHMKRTGGKDALHDMARNMLELVCQRVDTYGNGFFFAASGADEECERKWCAQVYFVHHHIV